MIVVVSYRKRERFNCWTTSNFSSFFSCSSARGNRYSVPLLLLVIFTQMCKKNKREKVLFDIDSFMDLLMSEMSRPFSWLTISVHKIQILTETRTQRMGDGLMIDEC